MLCSCCSRSREVSNDNSQEVSSVFFIRSSRSLAAPRELVIHSSPHVSPLARCGWTRVMMILSECYLLRSELVNVGRSELLRLCQHRVRATGMPWALLRLIRTTLGHDERKKRILTHLLGAGGWSIGNRRGCQHTHIRNNAVRSLTGSVAREEMSSMLL